MLPKILPEWIRRPTLEKVASRTLPDMPQCVEDTAPAMLFTLPRGCLQTRFGLHFCLLSAPFSEPWALKSRLNLEKKACPKNLENMCCENGSKTSEITSKTG